MDIKMFSTLISFLILVMAFTPGSLATNITTDQSSLLSLKSHINLSHHHILTKNWSIGTSVCNWIGVVCGSKHHRVIALDISTMGLVGTLPPQLGNLPFLIYLNMSNNYFFGDLPKELANLRRLQYMDFGYNNLSGKIPEEIGNLENAKWLILKFNQLDGPIPFTIFNISTLQFLSLRNNSLSGSLPENLCQHLRRLERLTLSFNKLNGDIPKGLSACSKLEELLLVHNNFAGMIPREIGNLTMLQFLHIGSNNLEGVIPREIRNLQRLVELGVEHNLLTGTIPELIFNISSLRIINVENNSLSGTLPPNMCSHLQKLEGLFLEKNKLYGNIPMSIGKCSSLQGLSMWGNQLNGFLPRQIGNLTMLKKLDLGLNALSGEIPKELGNLDKLELLELDHNALSGSLPWEIFNISMLRGMSLASNYLSGTLPFSMGQKLPNLQSLYLDRNNFRGVIPPQVSNASNLLILQLNQNQFTGFIPNSLGNLAQLEILEVASNSLTTDPKFSLINSMANCRYLQELQLSANPLNAMLPNSIGNLSTTLQMLILEYCNIRGRIPHEIGNLSNLYNLDMRNNEIIGFLPMTIQALQSLQGLYLSENRLEGSFPDVVCELGNLFGIDLGKNKFSGPISDCLGNISSLREIFLYENEFTIFPPSLWSLENLLRLDLHSNDLRGSLPREIGNAKTTILIDLSHNKLSGEIPSTIGGLTELIDFSVAHNTIQGSIPDTFGKLLDLHSLDLSDNNFSGMIPKSLEGLKSMNYFNVSYNRLTGEIPNGGPFANFTYESFLSNDGLCGSPRMNVPSCPANTLHTSNKNRVVLFVLISLAILVVFIASVVVLVIFRRRSREVLDEPNLLLGPTPARFSYNELQRATNRFDESNLLGSGSFGSVYKGTFLNGMHVAIKVFRLLHEGTNRSFDTECQVLRNIRHRNLTKVLGSCSNLDFKALVLDYMPNGCLHKWLYSHNYFLDMIQRVSIMIDVASALEYLHYGYSIPIIHCDLKPNNVLIDADMVGHLSDFGIAKLLGDGNSIAITNTLATIGYIAPEYGQEGLVSTRSDMYSYGIMLLEVFTRTQPGDEMFNEDLSLRSWVHNALPTKIDQIIDPNLLGADEEKYDEKLQCVLAIFELGLKCSTESPRERMTIKEALPALEKIKVQLLSLYHLCKNIK